MRSLAKDRTSRWIQQASSRAPWWLLVAQSWRLQLASIPFTELARQARSARTPVGAAHLLSGNHRKGVGSWRRDGVTQVVRPVVALFEVGLVLVLAEMLWSIASARLKGRSGSAALVLHSGSRVGGKRGIRAYSGILPASGIACRRLSSCCARYCFLNWWRFPWPCTDLRHSTLVPIWSGANLALPLPIRLTIAVSQPLGLPIIAGLAFLSIGVATLSARLRIPVTTVVRSLLTWRSDHWNTARHDAS